MHKEGSEMRFEGKNAIVTGGGKNIGRAISLSLAREGANVVVTARDKEALKKTVSDIRDMGRNCMAIVCDVRMEREIEKMVGKAVEGLGNIDILVNNVGISGPKCYLWELGIEDWNDIIDSNVRSYYLCTKYVLRRSMLSRKSGRIVNTAGTAGQGGYPLMAAYSVSKWGVISLTKTLAKEVGQYNIFVNAVVPGAIEGERIHRSIRQRAEVLKITAEEEERAYKELSPMRRFNRPEDVAKVVTFLASDDYLDTGQTINVSYGSSNLGTYHNCFEGR